MSLKTPIQYPVKYYSWQDTDAPQLSGTDNAGEFKTLLKACLVTGYGAKTGAGWQITETGDIATFKRDDPLMSHIALRIDNTDASGYLSIQYINSNQDIILSTNSATLAANTSVRPQPMPWHIVACAAGFIVMLGTYKDSDGIVSYTPFYFGSAASLDGVENVLIAQNKPNNTYYDFGDRPITLLSSPYFERYINSELVNNINTASAQLGNKQTSLVHPIYYLSDNYLVMLPIYASATAVSRDTETSIINVQEQQMLQIVSGWDDTGAELLNIPLDYWSI